MKEIISTDKAPAAIGPYSQAVKAGSFIFVSGQIPLDPETGAISGETIEEQAHRVFKNLSAVLESRGLSLENAVKTTVFLTDMGDFSAVNEVYKLYFKAGCPARSAVEVGALPKGAKIECELIAYTD
ncbi:MAG: RidA family protein [Clostridiales bacterium]|nr:RidA family protein [Clostridiales bacterium]